MAPRLPLNGATDEEVDEWKNDYGEWAKENSHLPGLMTTEELLSKPRLNSTAPKFPNMNAADGEVKDWKEKYEKWREENSHINTIQPADAVWNRVKGQGPPAQQNNAQMNTLSGKVNALEVKVDKLMAHFGVK